MTSHFRDITKLATIGNGEPGDLARFGATDWLRARDFSSVPMDRFSGVATAGDFSGLAPRAGSSFASAPPAAVDVIPAGPSTTASVAVGGSFSSAIDHAGDEDWIAVQLVAGQKYNFKMTGSESGGGSLEDTFLTLYDASGNAVASNDDSGGGLESAISGFTATYSGAYFIGASAYDTFVGTYTVSATVGTTPSPGSVLTYDQIADQLVEGYWNWSGYQGSSWRAFTLDASRTLTVNLNALTADGASLARAALATWSDVTGIKFVETAGPSDISFDDNEDGAFAESVTAGNEVVSAHVNVDIDWLNSSGSSLDSYTFQTYIHEIGHALGLGHAGDYNAGGTFGVDNDYDNDSWQATVMSYFSQDDNVFVNADFGYVLSPQIADIIAIQRLYGAATATRTGDTTYGFSNNTGNPIYGTGFTNNVTLTIYDNGGTDTLDYSGYAASQLFDLRPEGISNIGGYAGNIEIARGTLIENAIGGAGSDLFIGNQANNHLNGGGGVDRASYAGVQSGYTLSKAADGVSILVTDIDLSNGNDGTDVLSNIEFASFAGADVDLSTIGGPATSWFQDVSDVKTVAATWQLFMNIVPTAAGFEYLVQSAVNPTDLNDPYFAQFNEANRYIAFSSNLGTETPASKAWFDAEYGSLTYTQAVDKAFEAIISSAALIADGGDPAASKAFFLNGRAYFEAVALERLVRPGVDLDDATKLAMLSSVLYESVKADVGVYAEAVNDFAAALAASGTSPYFGQSLFDTV